ncbi:MAG TPA: hypothetical protein DCS09_05690 [Porphyromonadaceae bacterium]|nr:hypothetical protein [Porphyromonadaceae bacterium]
MEKMRRSGSMLVTVFVLALSTAWAHAGARSNTTCPVNYITGIQWDDEFGYGASELTRCLERRHNLKVVVQINQLYNTGSTTQSYGIGNINNILNDYEITHGLQDRDYELVVVIHGAGGPMVLNNNALEPNEIVNPFQSQIEALISKGVKVYICHNTARNLNLKVPQLIPGVGFVPSGVSAIIDFQKLGYVYLQP